MLRRSCPTSAILMGGQRFISRGALAGGFSKEALQRWGSNHFQDRPLAVDLFSRTISPNCTSWLTDHPHPSATVAKSLYQCHRFMPERVFLTPVFYKNAKLPLKFTVGERFLAWTVVVDTPHEMILEWVLGGYRGCTMVAFDPSLRRIYQGNCIDVDVESLNYIESLVLLTFHGKYAQFLLDGMVKTLEQQSKWD